MQKPQFTKDRLTATVLHFGDRLLLVFSYPLFFREFHKDLPLIDNPGISPRGLLVLPTIQRACLISTLVALRDIDDILTPRTKDTKPSALRAVDIGFPITAPFLTRSERRDINTVVVHSTKWAANTEGKNSLNMKELLAKGYDQATNFVKWVKDNHDPKRHSAVWAAAGFYLEQAEAVGRILSKFNARHMPPSPLDPAT